MSSAFAALDKDKDGLVTKKDFERSFTTLSSVQVAVFSKKCQAPTSLQVDACFKKFDKDKDGMLNFVEFKNFMGKRKSLPDKVTFAQVFLLRKFYNTRPRPAFGRLALGGLSGGYSSHGYTSYTRLRAYDAELGGD